MNPIKYFKDGMYGKAMHFDKTVNFLQHEDSEETLERNRKSQPADWIYRTETITYQYNSNGHRCIDIDELPEDYILFTGCSHTEGIGLQLEKTYPYLVAQHFNKAYYNLALGGSGPDLAMINMLGFLSKAKYKPKLVIIQWPNFNRFFKVIDANLAYILSFYTPSQQDKFYTFLLKENFPYLQNILNRKIILQNLANYGIHNIIESNDVYNINKHEDSTVKAVFGTQFVDKARDLCHGGIESNKLWANSLIDTINKNFAHVI